MGIFSDFFSDTNTSTRTTDETLPSHIRDPSVALATKAGQVGTSDYTPYGGERVAGFSPDQQMAFDRIRSMVTGAPDLGAESLEGARAYAAAPGQQAFDPGRIIDEGGALGGISDYMNPYLREILQPQLRELDEGTARERNRIGALATGSGSAFGDARHGILEGESFERSQQARGDVTGKAFKDAWDAAMGMRSGDLARMTGASRDQAAYNEQEIQRGLEGTGALQPRQAAEQGNMLQRLNALLGSGGQQQEQQQQQLDALYEEFLREYGHDTDTLTQMIRAIGATPYGKSSTSTLTEPNNAIQEILGAAIGAAGTAAAGM